MSYDRDEYMRRQDADHAMIAMRTPLPNSRKPNSELERLQRERDYAVRWANQSVEMLQEAFFPLADALRDLEAYLRNTPHHNAMEAAAARKALAKFDEAKDPRCTPRGVGNDLSGVAL